MLQDSGCKCQTCVELVARKAESACRNRAPFSTATPKATPFLENSVIEKGLLTLQLRALILFGRNGGIRTRDPLHPMQVRYQAALHSVLLLRIIGRKNSLPEKSTHFFQKSAKRLPLRAFRAACTCFLHVAICIDRQSFRDETQWAVPVHWCTKEQVFAKVKLVDHEAALHIQNDCYSTLTISQAPTLNSAPALTASSSQILCTKLVHTRDSPV